MRSSNVSEPIASVAFHLSCHRAASQSAHVNSIHDGAKLRFNGVLDTIANQNELAAYKMGGTPNLFFAGGGHVTFSLSVVGLYSVGVYSHIGCPVLSTDRFTPRTPIGASYFTYKGRYSHVMLLAE
tara:strand:- start:21 stop:398 length:378 start_codon:yes stop_codon:yes gene_type:complete